MVCASYYASYLKVSYIRHEVNMQFIYCITSLLLKPSMSFHASCDLTISSKNRKMKINQKEMKIRIRK